MAIVQLFFFASAMATLAAFLALSRLMGAPYSGAAGVAGAAGAATAEASPSNSAAAEIRRKRENEGIIGVGCISPGNLRKTAASGQYNVCRGFAAPPFRTPTRLEARGAALAHRRTRPARPW